MHATNEKYEKKRMIGFNIRRPYSDLGHKQFYVLTAFTLLHVGVLPIFINRSDAQGRS